MLVTFAAIAVAGCASGPKAPDQASVIKDITLSNNAVVLRQLDLQMERERTRQKEVDVDLAMSGGLMKIAESATDAHTKVVAAVALLGQSKGRGNSGAAQPAAMPQLPPQQAILPERDWLDRGLQVASILLPGGVPAILSPVLAAGTAAKQIKAQTDQAAIAAQTQQALYASFTANNQATTTALTNLGLGGINGVRDVGLGMGNNLRDLGLGGINGVRDTALGMGLNLERLGATGFTTVREIVADLGRPNQNTWIVGGDFAGGNLVGRYSGQASGNSGTLNYGAGILNYGDNGRFTSPGPYTIQPTCTSGNAAPGGQNGAGGSSGAVTCPATDVQK